MRNILLTITLILLVFAAASAAYSQAPEIKYRLELLTIEKPLKSVAAFQGGVIAVGGKYVIIAFDDGARLVDSPAEAELRSVACGRESCLAVGRDGASILFFPESRSFRQAGLPKRDYLKVAATSSKFYVAYREGVLECSSQGEVIQDIKLPNRVLDLDAGGERVAVLTKKGIVILDETGREDLSTEGLRSCKSILLGEGLWIECGSLYRWNGSAFIKEAEGSFNPIAETGDSLILSADDSIYLYSPQRGEEFIAALSGVNGIAASNDTAYIAADDGLLEVNLSEKTVKRLFIASQKFVDVASNGGKAVIVADSRVYLYESGRFRDLELPTDTYHSASISGDKILVLGEMRLIEVVDGDVKPLPLKVEEGGSIHLSGYKAYLASDKGLFEIDLRSASIKQLLKANLLKVTEEGACGEGVIAPFGGDVIEINFTARDLDAVGCTLIAVGQAGKRGREGAITVYREGGGIEAEAVAEPLTSVELTGRYGLIGGAKGGLYIFDGYTLSAIPYNLGEEIRGIAWIGEEEALIATETKLYRFVEEQYPQPTLKLEKPEYVKLYNGTETEVKLVLKPMNGFKGEVDVDAISEADGLSVKITPNKLQLREMCPAELELKIRAESWMKGNGKITILYGSGSDELTVVVEPKMPKQTNPTSRGFLGFSTWELLLISAISLACLAAAYRLSRRSRKEEVEEVAEEGGEVGGEIEEW